MPTPIDYRLAMTAAAFAATGNDEVVGRLVAHDRGRAGTDAGVEHLQTLAWSRQITFLKATVSAFRTRVPAEGWTLAFEFDIPRRGKRIDAVVIARSFIAVLEFKTGDAAASVAGAIRQVDDYVAELADFHAASRDVTLVPIVVSPSATFGLRDFVSICTTPDELAGVLIAADAAQGARPAIDPNAWLAGHYAPTPTIVEAARHLYANHSVAALARSEAESHNLTRTQDALAGAIELARRGRRKIACFVTGVPGAGKTLAGLNAAVAANRGGTAEAVYLSGNGPLVTVLGEALALDESRRERIDRESARRRSGQFVQGVHRFIDHYLADASRRPAEHVAVFDEAQRAWNAAHALRKFGRAESEPASMLRVMDRHDWAVLICLVGGGQEINTGEAGLAEWGRAIESHFAHWQIRVSPALLHGAHASIGQTLFASPPERASCAVDDALHLDVPLRSYRSTAVARWVDALLVGDLDAARVARPEPDRFPIVLTRSAADARRWLRRSTRGLRRAGLIASSGGKRLRALGVDVDNEFDVAKWFLAPHDDVRSSTYLELVATEFAVQGLELDVACVGWDADLRVADTGGWSPQKFRGTAWQRVHDPATRQFILNKYRVLLTRAREGMAIWVPNGDASDPTRAPEWYDAIADRLRHAGAQDLTMSIDS